MIKKLNIYNSIAKKVGKVGLDKKGDIFTEEKVTWEFIYEDFKMRHPIMKEQVIYWRPYSYAAILLYLDDGRQAIYDYDKHMFKFINSRWIQEK